MTLFECFYRSVHEAILSLGGAWLGISIIRCFITLPWSYLCSDVYVVFGTLGWIIAGTLVRYYFPNNQEC